MVKSKYTGFFGWAFMNGLMLGILFTNGQDISETGIISTVLKAINTTIPIAGYFWMQAILFTVGLVSIISEAYVIYKDGTGSVVLALSCFLGIFLLILGTGLNISFLTNVGIFFFIISILIEGYLTASER